MSMQKKNAGKAFVTYKFLVSALVLFGLKNVVSVKIYERQHLHLYFFPI
jgi:hypothetical protein